MKSEIAADVNPVVMNSEQLYPPDNFAEKAVRWQTRRVMKNDNDCGPVVKRVKLPDNTYTSTYVCMYVDAEKTTEQNGGGLIKFSLQITTPQLAVAHDISEAQLLTLLSMKNWEEWKR